MHSYAQTNIQLYNQLARQEYSTAEIVEVRRAYDVAQHLFSGRYRPSGKSFLSHLIGTASILAELRAPLPLVLAGLLHAAYQTGDFGVVANWSLNAKRRQLKRSINADTESILAAYAAFAWNTESILEAHRNCSSLTQLERDVLLVRLVNDLEDNLDLAVLYCVNRQERMNYLQRCGPAMCEIASALGFPLLATELERSHQALLSEKNLEAFPFATDQAREWMLLPASYRKRFVPAATDGLLLNGRRAVRKIRRLAQQKRKSFQK